MKKTETTTRPNPDQVRKTREPILAAVRQILGLARAELIVQLGYLVSALYGGETTLHYPEDAPAPWPETMKDGQVPAGIEVDFQQELKQDWVVFTDTEGQRIPYRSLSIACILYLIRNIETLQD